MHQYLATLRKGGRIHIQDNTASHQTSTTQGTTVKNENGTPL